MIYFGCLYFSVLPKAHAVKGKIVGSSQSPPETGKNLRSNGRLFTRFWADWTMQLIWKL